MTTKQFIVLAVVVGALYVLIESLLPETWLKVAIEVFLFLAVCVFSAMSGRHAYKTREKGDATNIKAEITPSRRNEPLSKQEIGFLKKKLTRKMAAAVGAFLFIFCVYLVFANFIFRAAFGEMGEYLFWMLSATIFLGAVYLFAKRFLKLQHDIHTGKKLVVFGNISRWEKYQYNDYEYVLYVDEIAFKVKSATFNKYLKGDGIEVHLFEPWQNTVLYETKIEMVDNALRQS